jgi:hypothetical protein
VESDGTVENSSYSTIGHIASDGTVEDASYTTIAHFPGVDMKWAAVIFFFDFR